MANDFLIRVYSFSYRLSGPPYDVTENGGGFVFDCRGLPNPGRDPHLATLTGLDTEVITMLSSYDSVEEFVNTAISLISVNAASYTERHFSDLQVSFGCTGGRHRSVYCAELAANKLRSLGYQVVLCHWQMEQEAPETADKKRAMILAAGLGTRLAPLTDSTPKALVQAGNMRMLDWTIKSIAKAGFNGITINTHHFPEQMRKAIKEHMSATPATTFHISKEESLLGTGGGLRNAARFLFCPSPVLVHNVDIWSNFDLQALYDQHTPTALATLAVQERTSSRYLLVDEKSNICGRSIHGEVQLCCEPTGRLTGLGYSGIMVASPELLALKADTFGESIIDFLLDRISMGDQVKACNMQGNWFDIGTVVKLERLQRFLSTSRITQ